LERSVAEAMPITRGVNGWEGLWPLGAYVAHDESKVGTSNRERLRDALKLTQADYATMIARRQEIRDEYQRAAKRYDGFVTLAATGAAPIGLTSTGDPGMNVAASLLGCPALSLPILEDEGLPLGLQLMGGIGRDTDLFHLAATVLRRAFERADLVGQNDA
jgi:Asp-tRNA(Asn)/Glu-tRNA(Gln) amidotransferase A subunit family amidase